MQKKIWTYECWTRSRVISAQRWGGGRMKIFSSVHDETHLKIVWSQIPDFLHILHS